MDIHLELVRADAAHRNVGLAKDREQLLAATGEPDRWAIIHFLLVYDCRLQALRSQQAFTKVDEATIAYQRLEQQYRAEPEVEIVLVGADSIDTIRRTHGHSFEGVALPVTV